MMRRNENGNVLYYILIAVALLAALSYAVAQGSRSSTKALTQEKDALMAAEIIDFADVIKKSVSTLRLRGVSVENLEFSYAGSAGYDNAGCAADDCNIFSAGGGGVLYKKPNAQALESAQDWIITAANEIQDVGTTAGDATSTDFLAVLTEVRQGVCIEINNKLGVTNPLGVPPEDADMDTTVPYAGGGTDMDYKKTIGDDPGATDLAGRTAGCFEETASGKYYYYDVLIPR